MPWAGAAKGRPILRCDRLLTEPRGSSCRGNPLGSLWQTSPAVPQSARRHERVVQKPAVRKASRRKKALQGFPCRAFSLFALPRVLLMGFAQKQRLFRGKPHYHFRGKPRYHSVFLRKFIKIAILFKNPLCARLPGVKKDPARNFPAGPFCYSLCLGFC